MASRAERQAKLLALKAAKAGPGKPQRTEDLYDVVDEDTYASIVKERLLADDFIIDDDGSGYVDNGEEEDFKHDGSSDEEENGKRRRKKDAKGKPEPKKRLTTAFTNGAAAAQVKQAVKPVRPPVADLNPYKKKVDVAQEADFMDSLLGDLTSTTSTSFMSQSDMRKRKTTADSHYSRDSLRASTASSFRTKLSSSSDPASADDLFSLRRKNDPSSDGADLSWNNIDDSKRARTSGVEDRFEIMDFDASFDGGDAFMADAAALNGAAAADEMDIAVKKPAAPQTNGAARPRQLVNVTSVKARRPARMEDEEIQTEQKKPKGMDWRVATAAIAIADASSDPPPVAATELPSTEKKPRGKAAILIPQVNKSNIKAFEEDGSLRFYWLDYVENNGAVNLFGKVFDKETKKYVSCCVTVNGIERNLFILPRGSKTTAPKKAKAKPKKAATQMDLNEDAAEAVNSGSDWGNSDDEEEAPNSEDEGQESEYKPTMDDVEDDIDDVLRQAGVSQYRHKEVVRKYAFEVPGVPAETRWLKLKYGFDKPQLPLDLSGRTFSHVFGTNTSAFELFAIKRKIMGPCWLKVLNGEVSEKPVKERFSWCKLELSVTNPKHVNPFSDREADAPKDTPPLNIMSLTIRTVINTEQNKNEIACATARVWQGANLDDTTPIEKQICNLTTVVRPLGKNFPAGFEEAAKASKSTITPVRAERVLLNNLLATIQRYDPDIIVGHEFAGVTLDVLLHRMKELKVDFWSRIGRVQRGDRWPRLRNHLNSHILNGRLILDLASEGSKQMIASTTWSLTEMCQSHLKVERVDIDPEDLPDFFDPTASKPDKLIDFIQHCEADSFFQMAIANKVQALPLTKQLTNLAGNSWNRTLGGGRAERNEYILLHEFHKGKFICPDKISRWEKKQAKASADPEDDDDGKGKSKRDKYKGGLVFEPKRGLWDKFILVMDFNSLYPSIIQEFNIDFTTVERTPSADPDEPEKIPEVPTIEERGVLPRLIRTLVERRKAVKSLMKDPHAGPAKQLEWDIKQKALKLTANSMYGCLGFEGSRFYARPLAALTTFKGREILTNTRELAESQQLDVIYGDTDSVMINTNAVDLKEALLIGGEFKKAVNERYKLLEIDIDAVFQRMLLLQKKKYAAVEVKANGETSIEIKGLDMKRREYCALSKNVSGYVLKQILSGDPTELVVEAIHEYLSSVGEGVRGGKVSLDDFIIWKRLGKNPQDYPDAKSLPHVQVAMRQKQRGQDVKQGDVIPYIFCVGEDGIGSTRTAQADRAHHPDELRRPDSNLKIDFEYYLSLQVLPPVERLCTEIEGTEKSRLADCLGLDTSRFSLHTAGSNDVEREFHTLESQISDAERFKDAEPLKLRCRRCTTEMTYAGMLKDEHHMVRPSGITCINADCCSILDINSITVQVEIQIRSFIAKFYESWLVCDDASCATRTRQMSVYGKRCLAAGCRGTMHYDYSDARLYNQLLFFDHMFDVEKAKASAAGTSSQDEIIALTAQNATEFGIVQQAVRQYLDRCGRRYVGFKGLFSFMRI